MDDSAIKLIQDTAVTAAGGIQNELPAHMVIVPEGMKLVDLEKNLDGRTRYRGAFVTQSLPDFIRYVLANASKAVAEQGHRATEGFIDADKHQARVFLNLANTEGEPGHADWTGSLTLKATAAYNALRGIEGQKLIQRQLIDWLEDWGRNIVEVISDAGEPMTLSATIVAFRSLTIAAKKESTHTQGDRSAQRTAMEEIEAKAKGQFPDRIRFACEPFLGLPQRTFELRVGVLTDHEDPRIVLRIVGKEEHEEAIAQDFKAELEKGIGDAFPLTVGTFAP